ncbi:MAG: FadR/GntR family transcriptional regulator [Gammaproteobacteria bacterium]|nr:FadR/GntR family transcriptional regulator [Gammaproteobacteria bacterium]MDE0281088.1 FadR/GntR family transcriptional regulator [Gammaproteobacteria bacterium]MDE0713316.1 FadR/GntR family transcriptional regulator [Gammaproteobacteria bacterium]MXY66876.1 FadR family transcriptional regulator [Gammaproteobacteria bacterium]MYG66903.1 FadR family transcriptional regulator [Gammaproteobacteria bacterium]
MRKVSYEPLMTASLAKQIAERIRESITDGTLKADDQLPTEEELARQFRVSRPTIREALKRLAAQSLIRSRRGPTGGTFINRPSHEEVSSSLTTATALLVSLGEFKIPEILEARQELEVLCVLHAAERCNEAELSELAREIEIQRQASVSDEAFCASDVRFHRAIADATHNSVLKFVMYTVIEALQPIENMVVFRFREREVIVRQHEEILSALRAKDGEAAAQSIREQIAYLRERFDAAQAMRRQKAAGVQGAGLPLRKSGS